MESVFRLVRKRYVDPKSVASCSSCYPFKCNTSRQYKKVHLYYFTTHYRSAYRITTDPARILTSVQKIKTLWLNFKSRQMNAESCLSRANFFWSQKRIIISQLVPIYRKSSTALLKFALSNLISAAMYDLPQVKWEFNESLPSSTLSLNLLMYVLCTFFRRKLIVVTKRM